MDVKSAFLNGFCLLYTSDAADEEEKPKDDANGEFQDVEVEPMQPLLKDWRYATNHLKDLIIGDVSKGVTTHSKLHDICGHFAFISHIKPKNMLEADSDSILVAYNGRKA